MYPIVQEFVNVMKEKLSEASNIEERGDKTVITLTYDMPNAEFTVIFSVREDSTDVSLMCTDLIKVPEEKFKQAVFCCNELNQQYRWVRFWADRERKKIIALADTMVHEGNGGADLYELAVRMGNIIDEAFPKLCKAIWDDTENVSGE